MREIGRGFRDVCSNDVTVECLAEPLDFVAIARAVANAVFSKPVGLEVLCDGRQRGRRPRRCQSCACCGDLDVFVLFVTAGILVDIDHLGLLGVHDPQTQWLDKAIERSCSISSVFPFATP
jgi:hypothetical protein